MKYLQTYKKLNLKEDEKDIFEYLIETLTDSIFTWDYFVGFEKVKKNIHLIEKELNLLNVLIGKDDIEKELISLISEYPNVRKVLPILIAIRNNKLKDLKIIDDFEELKSESKIDLFNPTKELTSELKEDLINFFKESGLKDIFQDKDVKSIVDYCFGVEVGMDTNARKNRTGQSMESIVENIIQKFAEKNNLDYIPQATQKKIKEKWNFDIELDKTNRIFDFAVFEKTKNKIFIIETNYYSGGRMKTNKRIIKINKEEFLHWYFEKEEIMSIGKGIVEDLKNYEISDTVYTLESFYAQLGYLPENLIENKEQFKDLLTEGEIGEGDLTTLKPRWV